MEAMVMRLIRQFDRDGGSIETGASSNIRFASGA
jgi:hypothetical protein